MPYKLKKHVSIYLDERLFRRVQESASARKMSLNQQINQLLVIGLAKRDEELLGLDQIARAIKADLQLQRDELKRQSNRLASLLSRIGLHAIAARYQGTYMHAKLTDGDTAKKTADSGWKYALEKLKEKTDTDDSEK